MKTSLSKATREIAAGCLCRATRELSRRITRDYDEALRGVGVTANQLTVLVAVERAGELAPGDLGERLGMEKSTVSRTVARMVERGWLNAGPAAGPRRWLRTTASGRRLITRAHAAWREAQRRAERTLGSTLAAALREERPST